MIHGQRLLIALKKPQAQLSFFVFSVYVLVAVLACLGWLEQDAKQVNLEASYLSPSWDHWLGTDFLGRDVFARIIHGSQLALLVGLFASGLSTTLGLFLGTLAGYFGGWVDNLIVWLYSTFSSIPYILLISAFSYTLGQGLFNLLIALGLTGWVKMCRLTRAEFLKQRDLEYVSAAQALGATHIQRIIQILPNMFHLFLIQFSLFFIQAIKIEVILSYLGLGVKPGTPSWGMMINDAKVDLTRGVWWNLSSAAISMFFLILSIYLLSEVFRKVLDPREHERASR